MDDFWMKARNVGTSLDVKEIPLGNSDIKKLKPVVVVNYTGITGSNLTFSVNHVYSVSGKCGLFLFGKRTFNIDYAKDA